MSFKEFLHLLRKRDSFCISKFEDAYPGLKHKFNRSLRGADLNTKENYEALISRTGSGERKSSQFPDKSN